MDPQAQEQGVDTQVVQGTPGEDQQTDGLQPVGRFHSFLLTFPLMMLVWVVLSGKFDAFHLGCGVFSCALVAWFSGDLLFPYGLKRHSAWILFVRFPAYLPWLLYQIFLANMHLLKLTFSPRIKDAISPRVIRFHSKLKSELAITAFANSITLTPGTITVRVSYDGDFVVHAIDKASADPLPGEMEERIARALGEE